MYAAAFTAGAIAPSDLRAVPPGRPGSFDEQRNHMVDEEIVGGGITDARVVQAMRDTPRHEFVPLYQRPYAYYDMALAIGEQQTISGPFVVAYMTEQLDPQPTDKVLEIGTGSGYQAAVLSPLCKEVYTIEILPGLGRKAEQTLKRLKYNNVFVKIGDGYQGWPENAPFDRIIVTCSPEKVPQALVDQLKEGGRMIVPVGERYQQMLYLFKKQDGKLVSEALKPTLFVPMTGTAEKERKVKPDPLNPRISNSSFEEAAETGAEPATWYYPRQMTWVTGKDSPSGNHYVTFTNDLPGRTSRALQGVAIDGRKVHELHVTAMVRAKNIRPGQSPDELPVLMLSFYDENRGNVGRNWVGPWRGSFDWKKVSEQIPVPPQAREMSVHIGLMGAVGEISFDDVAIEAAK